MAMVDGAANLSSLPEPVPERSSDSPVGRGPARSGRPASWLPVAGSPTSFASPVVLNLLAVLLAGALLQLQRSWLLNLVGVFLRPLRLITLLERPG
jgi:hypothetical protein